MSRKPIIAAGDVVLHGTVDPFRYGRRFSLDVAEEALDRIVPRAVEHLTEKLTERVVGAHLPEIEKAVHDYILNREWAEPIIKQAIHEAVERVIREMLRLPLDAEPETG